MENSSFCQRVTEAANARHDKAAMTLIGPGGAETTTFGEMLSQIRGVAYRLSQEHIAFGDRVALIGENHPHWAIAYLGVLYRGAVAVPLDQAANIEALVHFIEDSEAKLAFVSPSSLDKFRAVCERLGRRIPAVILRDGARADGFARFEDWARTPRPPEFDAAHPPARPEDVAVLMYTSGTTGAPKAVLLTHGNIFAESEGVRKAMRVSDREIVLSLLPLFHAYSQVVNLWLATVIGAQVVYITELSSAEIERGLKEGAATALVGVPRLWYLFHKKIFDAIARRPPPVQWLFRAMLGLMRAMRASAGGLRAGKILNLYPEGQRSFDGRLQEFKKGAAILATELDLPIVPVAIDGTYRVWPRDSWRIRRAKVRIRFGEPFTPRSVIPEGMGGEAAYEAVTDEMKRRIRRMLDEMRRPHT